MNGDGPIYAVIGGWLLLIVLLIGLLVWGSQDFANRCERAGGMTINYEVCVPQGTRVLMTTSTVTVG